MLLSICAPVQPHLESELNWRFAYNQQNAGKVTL